MASKNKKKSAPKFAIPVPFLAGAVLMGGMVLGHLLMGSRAEQIGREIKILESKKLLLQRQLLNEEYKWSTLTSPQNMERALQQSGLAMTWPAGAQVVRIRDSQLAVDILIGNPEEAARYAELERIVRND